MFWGLIMEPNKRYTQTIEKSFHVSMASLDASTGDNEIIQVMLYYDNRTYLLCTLKKGLIWQVPLDLNFQEGTKIAFMTNGQGHVHLTGYLMPEDDNLDLDELEEEEEDTDEDVPSLTTHPKRKALEVLEKDTKIKRAKIDKLRAEAESSNDDDDEDDVFDDSKDGEDSEDVEDEENENEMADNDSDEEDESSDNDSDEDEEEKKESEKTVPVTKKQQQQTKKAEKQKLVNGKGVKQEQDKSEKNKNDQQNAKQEPKKKTIKGGIHVEDLKIGTGVPAQRGKFVSVYYVGRLANGKKFDSTTSGDGFKFRLGKGEVIKGMDLGITGMNVGGKRKITIPPAMGYGAKGSLPLIPANSTLVFEVTLKNVY
ncbi:46 kDa FK506-binding nuclear protein [Orussus abietinus]|uniref:46 kDa FK506-binding nuclear protein n=1 Tax=Orussus abietinus TaxID=222816 RepID=UPI0006256D23|nr:46 kDa FK506-binding nuclear protein [Orussus abietinus]